MAESLEALLTLWKFGTMVEAASHLRVTPSAVSKRIALLEDLTGYKVIEKTGRLVKLTPAGLKLAQRVEPLLSDLKIALSDHEENDSGELSIGVSESILASWGASALISVRKFLPRIELKLFSHRSPVVMERVLSGEVALGLCAGLTKRWNDLDVSLLGEESMVIVPSGLTALKLNRKEAIEVLSIEPHAATWESLKPQLRRLSQEIKVVETLQSFSSVVQLARAGHRHGLVPYGIAKSMGIKDSQLLNVPGLKRPIHLIGRRSTMARDLVRKFHEALHSEVQSAL